MHIAIAIEVCAHTKQTRAMVICLYEYSMCMYIRLNALNVLHGPRFNAPTKIAKFNAYWHHYYWLGKNNLIAQLDLIFQNLTFSIFERHWKPDLCHIWATNLVLRLLHKWCQINFTYTPPVMKNCHIACTL